MIPAANLEAYWSASKSRIDRWGRTLKRYKETADSADENRRRALWQRTRVVIEEVLSGEVLTRVWTAVLCAHDRRRDTELAGPIAKSVMNGHLETRHRALNLLAHEPSIEVREAAAVNRYRRRVERWTDLLIAHLIAAHDVSEFAPNPERARDFAEDIRHKADAQSGISVWPVTLASLRAAFRDICSSASPNADLNARIASAIVGCFPADVFETTGIFRSLWLTRLMCATDEAQVLIDKLFDAEGGISEAAYADRQAAQDQTVRWRFDGD